MSIEPAYPKQQQIHKLLIINIITLLVFLTFINNFQESILQRIMLFSF